MMTDDNDKQPPETSGDDDEPRTVALPRRYAAGAPPSPAPVPADQSTSFPQAPAAPSLAKQEPAPEQTSYAPPPVAPSLAKPAAPEAPSHTVPPAAPPAPAPPPPASPMPPESFTTDFQPRADGRSIKVGDVLNHMFEVKRFIARGGMGEVFEGINVNSEERVAIKVMLPSLAADPQVQAMFRKEARTLTRLQHEALVQYRTIAQEPQLGVLYIVTEFIDGTNLSDVMATLNPSPQDLAILLKRLASGLGLAHSLGAIHRDMSPDNVLLNGGRIDQPKVIDFGIAKDVANNTGTIVGAGFAGKLSYVAPEQLGDFGRDIGEWTDVYSLALVILAAATGKNVQLGGSLVDAVDKRRAGIDVSGAPPELRPVLTKMLKANPAERLRSMAEVVAELESGPARVLLYPGGGGGGSGGGGGGGLPKAAIFGIVALLLALAAAAGWWWMHRSPTIPGGGGGGTSSSGGTTTGDPIDVARGKINSALPNVNCAWLDIVALEEAGDKLKVKMTGVAGNVADASSEIARTLDNKADVDFGEVAPITQAGCAVLNGYKLFRSTEGHRMSVPQREFTMTEQGPGKAYAGKYAANSIVTLNIGDPKLDFTLIGIEPSGAISEIFPNRKTFDAIPRTGYPIKDLGNDKYEISIDLDHEGWSGLILVTGKGPFAKAVTEPALGARGADWVNKLAESSANGAWQSEMMWFKSVRK